MRGGVFAELMKDWGNDGQGVRAVLDGYADVVREGANSGAGW